MTKMQFKALFQLILAGINYQSYINSGSKIALIAMIVTGVLATIFAILALKEEAED